MGLNGEILGGTPRRESRTGSARVKVRVALIPSRLLFGAFIMC